MSDLAGALKNGSTDEAKRVADHQLKEELKRRARINEEARREMKRSSRPGTRAPRLSR